MKRILLIALLASTPAFAQDAPPSAMSRVVIGGVDQRIPPLENQFLAQETARAMQQLSKAAAMLSIERQDKEDAQKQFKLLSDRYAELMKICGDPCKPKPETPPPAPEPSK